MTDNSNHSPVALPPGSFDIQKLAKGLDSATKAADDKRDAALNKAIEQADESGQPAEIDQGARPDQKRVEVERAEGVTEQVLVHDPKSPAAEQDTEAAEQAERLPAGQKQRTKE